RVRPRRPAATGPRVVTPAALRPAAGSVRPACVRLEGNEPAVVPLARWSASAGLGDVPRGRLSLRAWAALEAPPTRRGHATDGRHGLPRRRPNLRLHAGLGGGSA